VIELLETALASEGARVTVRVPGAIAEVPGPLALRRGGEWLTLGDEGGAHVHLRASDVHALRFSAPADGNAALEVLDGEGHRLCRIAFSRTNRARPERFDSARLAEAVRRFGHLPPVHQ
jgi:hypothetical protein